MGGGGGTLLWTFYFRMPLRLSRNDLCSYTITNTWSISIQRMYQIITHSRANTVLVWPGKPEHQVWSRFLTLENLDMGFYIVSNELVFLVKCIEVYKGPLATGRKLNSAPRTLIKLDVKSYFIRYFFSFHTDFIILQIIPWTAEHCVGSFSRVTQVLMSPVHRHVLNRRIWPHTHGLK